MPCRPRKRTKVSTRRLAFLSRRGRCLAGPVRSCRAADSRGRSPTSGGGPSATAVPCTRPRACNGWWAFSLDNLLARSRDNVLLTIVDRVRDTTTREPIVCVLMRGPCCDSCVYRLAVVFPSGRPASSPVLMCLRHEIMGCTIVVVAAQGHVHLKREHYNDNMQMGSPSLLRSPIDCCNSMYLPTFPFVFRVECHFDYFTGVAVRSSFFDRHAERDWRVNYVVT